MDRSSTSTGHDQDVPQELLDHRHSRPILPLPPRPGEEPFQVQEGLVEAGALHRDMLPMFQIPRIQPPTPLEHSASGSSVGDAGSNSDDNFNPYPQDGTSVRSMVRSMEISSKVERMLNVSGKSNTHLNVPTATTSNTVASQSGKRLEVFKSGEARAKKSEDNLDSDRQHKAERDYNAETGKVNGKIQKATKDIKTLERRIGSLEKVLEAFGAALGSLKIDDDVVSGEGRKNNPDPSDSSEIV